MSRALNRKPQLPVIPTAASPRFFSSRSLPVNAWARAVEGPGLVFAPTKLVEIDPKPSTQILKPGILSPYQPNLLFSPPPLQLLLPSNGIPHIPESLKINQAIHRMLPRKPRHIPADAPQCASPNPL